MTWLMYLSEYAGTLIGYDGLYWFPFEGVYCCDTVDFGDVNTRRGSYVVVLSGERV
mgnify:CR=1 FL=1